MRLRLEKEGSRFRAYAGNEEDRWYCCGEVDLPGWEQLEVGMYGDYTAEVGNRAAERFAARCWDLRLEQVHPLPLLASGGNGLYPLPAPAYAPNLSQFVTADRKMLRLLKQIHQAADSSLPTLIEGATGTGKELVARALHQLGDRARQPFVPLNCAALPANLLESELFGHVRGAFTGAYDTRAGLFEVADNGILFLDEIGDASPELQARLLRVLEEQTVRRVGDQKPRPVDVRIVAATNRDLRQAIAQGAFRQDLYYRLEGIELRLPPLRQRPDDIPHLVAHALHLWSQRRGISHPGITREAIEALLAYDWPGNVRELLHAVERAGEESAGNPIDSTHLSIQVPRSAARPRPTRQDDHQQITEALRQVDNNVTEAARKLGIHRNTLYRKMRRLGIEPPSRS